MKRVTSSDVLSLLREYKLEKKPIRQKDAFLYFNNAKFPLSTETGTNRLNYRGIMKSSSFFNNIFINAINVHDTLV